MLRMNINNIYIDLNTDFLIRLLICFSLSILIGIERQSRNKIVGLRTNILISTGTFFFVSAAFLFNHLELFRMAAGVISGVGFIGAGLIIKEGCKIKGLDTAITLWTSSSVGLLCGCNLLIEAVYATLMILFANIFIRAIINKINYKNNQSNSKLFTLKIQYIPSNDINIRQLLINTIKEYNLIITSLDSHLMTHQEIIICNISTNLKNTTILENILQDINKLESVTSIGWSIND